MRLRRQGGRKHERKEGISLSWRRDTQLSAVALACAATLCAIHIAVHQAARFQPRKKLTTVILKLISTVSGTRFEREFTYRAVGLVRDIELGCTARADSI